jgi:hypothetical protein
VALTPEEKLRVLSMLDELDRSETNLILSSLEAFGRWLQTILYLIYCKVKQILDSLWRGFRNVFLGY